MEDIHEKVNSQGVRLDMAARAFKEMQARIERLEKLVEGHGTLLVELRGQEAVDLHCSFDYGKRDREKREAENALPERGDPPLV